MIWNHSYLYVNVPSKWVVSADSRIVYENGKSLCYLYAVAFDQEELNPSLRYNGNERKGRSPE